MANGPPLKQIMQRADKYRRAGRPHPLRDAWRDAKKASRIIGRTK